MLAPLAKFIDWSALQLAYVVAPLRLAPESKWRLAEALQFLNGPDFIPAASNPAQIEFDGPRNFKFPTPRPSEHEENNIAYGRLCRCAQRWQQRPVIILLDGSPAGGYHTVFPWIARRFNRAGFNVAAWVAAYHLQRRPRRPFEQNWLEFARAMAQNIAEIRALTGWLLEQGCPSVALLGISFGGWLAGLTACSDPRLAAVVMTMPAVAFRSFSSPPVVWRRVRETLQALRPGHEALDTTRLNLLLSTPVIPKENILLIAGMYDLFADPQPLQDLWQKWEQPEIWRLPNGHVNLAPGLMGRILRWLSPRLDKPFSPDPGTPPNQRGAGQGGTSVLWRAGSAWSALSDRGR